MTLAQVKGWLKAQYNIQVHSEWVEACLDWIKSEHQGQVLNDNNLNYLVYEQWLGSDLSEIAPPVLPDGINKQVKTELKGKYCLQMNSIADVSESAYSQLQQAKGKVNENVLVTATQPTQTQFKNSNKSSRMLMLYLTDGHQNLQAMEYKPIQCLNTNLLPGTKVVIEGSITCRLGVLMLSAEHIKVLGGEVDSLLESNSQIQLLTKALSDEGRTKVPEHFKDRITRRPVTNEPDKQPLVNKMNGASTDEDILMEDDDDFNDDILQELKEIEQQEKPHIQHEADVWPEDVDEEWPDDDDQWPDDSHILNIADNGKSQANSAGHQLQDNGEEWPDDDEQWPDDGDQWPDADDQWPDDDDHLLESIPDDALHPGETTTKVVAENNIHLQDTKPKHRLVCETKPMVTERSWSSSSSNSTFGNYTLKSKPVAPKQVQQVIPNRQKVQPQSVVTDQSSLPNIGLDHNLKREVKKETVVEDVIIITDDEEEEEEDMNQCTSTKSEIISLQESLQLTQGNFKIKGHFTTLITGLSYDSSGWKLSATVTDDDGKTTLDVDLDDKVLSQLIGFTVLEMMLMKKEMKNNKKEVAIRIKSGLSECQEALKKMHCVMVIKKTNLTGHPCVIEVDYQKS
ncbi:recQ-mediated genome instability protein 1-like [Antedon mediterranea]|uniref:recQ-mediated genome instability protein 1-like n=1 Tax=Antedon mediterranea TaxID=105859 RepID=UPI003AF78AAD